MKDPIFQSQRRKLLAAYAEQGMPINVRTIPYQSTGVIAFDVVDSNDTPSPGVAYAVAAKNQQVVFFNYGVGEQVFLGGNDNTKATEAETNVGKGSSTNGAQDFIIEGVGFWMRGARCAYASDEGNRTGTGAPANTVVQAALGGSVAMYDPAAINMPAQVQSPFNLENGVFQALLGYMSVDFLFDRKRVEKIGTIDCMPQAGASSFLRSNGLPTTENRYRIPEGYAWRRDGEPDSEFQANLTLQRDFVVPINGIIPYTSATSPAFPTTIYLEVVMRLWGIAVDLPSTN
jgi:hypothetical protein